MHFTIDINLLFLQCRYPYVSLNIYDNGGMEFGLRLDDLSKNSASAMALGRKSFHGIENNLEEKKLWSVPFLGLIHALLRECGVFLIVLETIILLLGYCLLVGLNFSFRCGYLYLYGNRSDPAARHIYDIHMDNHEIPPPVGQNSPYRGKMSRG